MLISSKLPKALWPEALNTTYYLANRSPLTTISCKTPLEIWLGKNVDYFKFRIFGRLTYVHVKQRKLEPSALKCRFL